jgi:hypothetical protein
LFDRLDEPAQRGLLGIEALGRPCDVTFFGNRDEIAELAQVHEYILRDMDFGLCIS